MKVPALTARRLLAGTAAVVAALGITTAASAATATHHSAASTIPKCTAGDLGVWVAVGRGNGTAGSIYYPLEFTNLSKSTCYLDGYPGVSAINLAGHQLGAAAGRDTAVKPSVVNIAPGATAHSELQYITVQVSPSCKPQAAYELKVYPPDQTFATDGAYDFSSCTTATPVYLNVEAIQRGTGTGA